MSILARSIKEGDFSCSASSISSSSANFLPDRAAEKRKKKEGCGSDNEQNEQKGSKKQTSTRDEIRRKFTDGRSDTPQ
jgi:hypothetical protein